MRCAGDCVDPGRCSPSKRSRSARRGEAESAHRQRLGVRSARVSSARPAPLRRSLPLAASVERAHSPSGRTHRTVLSKPRVSALPPAARPPHTVAGTCLRNVTYLHTFPDNVRLAISYRQIARPVHGAVNLPVQITPVVSFVVKFIRVRFMCLQNIRKWNVLLKCIALTVQYTLFCAYYNVWFFLYVVACNYVTACCVCCVSV